MAKNKKKFDEISYLKQFNPEDLLNWFQVIIIHPNNQLYLHRIEFIIGILFSIPEEEFGFNTPTQNGQNFYP
ncbi:MAG: hypothetical protein KDE26_16525 [Bacteroidetes bacterium]|nr:hypothetical protein [Bacteroidota bacterium]